LKVFILLLLSLHMTYLMASKTIQSGRPGQSIGAGVVGRGLFQIQSGYDIQKIDEKKSQVFNNVMRLGLNDNFEMSSLINYTSEDTKSGISDLHIGFRSIIVKKSKGLVPLMAVQTRFKLKSVDSSFKNKDVAPIITLSAVHNLNHNFSLTTNLGFSGSGNDSQTNYFWTTNLTYSLNDDISLFIEPYGNIVGGEQKLLFNLGCDYLINNDTKLDFSLGKANNDSLKESFLSLGISWRTVLLR